MNAIDTLLKRFGLTRLQARESGAAKSFYPGYGLYGGWDINSAMRYRDLPNNPMGIATAVTASVSAFACIQVRMEKIGSLPWEIRRRETDEVIADSEEPNPKHPLARAIQDVSGELGASLFALWEWGLCIHGEAFIEKTANVMGYPGGLCWLDPLYVQIYAPLNIIQSYRYNGQGGSVEIPKQSMVYQKYQHPYDPVRGLSPLEVALDQVNISRALSSEVLSYFKNAMRPSAFVAPAGDAVFDESDVEFIQEYLLNKVAGSANAHKPLIAPKAAKITPFEVPTFEDQGTLDERTQVAVHKAMRTPRAMTGDGDAQRYQDSDNTDEWFFANLIKPESSGMAKVTTREIMPFFDRSGEFYFAFNYRDYDYVSETEQKRADLVRADFEAGLITFNEARILRGEMPLDLATGKEVDSREAVTDYIKDSNAGLVPLSEAPELWKFKLTVAPSVYNSELITGEPLPQPVDPTQVVPTDTGAESLDPTVNPSAGQAPLPPQLDTTKDTGKPLFVGLDLANDPGLMELQSRLKAMYPNPACKWNEPSDFHITLLYAPNVDDTTSAALSEALAELTPPDMALVVGSLHTFDNVGEHALHFRIRRNVALLEYQALIYDLCQELGIPVSPYSLPADYTPHITMGYLPEKVSAITYQGKVKVTPKGAWADYGDTVLWDSNPDDDSEPPDNPDEPINAPDDETKTKAANPFNQTNALEELKAWRKVAEADYTRAFAFETHHLDATTAQLVRSDLDLAGSDKDAVKAVFKAWRVVLDARQGKVNPVPLAGSEVYLEAKHQYGEALDYGRESIPPDVFHKAYAAHTLSILSIKALADTRARFEPAIEAQMLAAVQGKFTRGKFVLRMLTTITRWGRQAAIDAYKDAGIEIDLDDSEDDEAIEASRWLDDYVGVQETYVNGIADRIYEDDVITIEEVKANKPGLWFNGSIMPIYNHFLIEASKNARLEWVYSPEASHCKSCLALNGIVLTAKRWKSEDIAPQSHRLQCSIGCKCRLVPTKKKKHRGALPRWEYAKSVDIHDHDHSHEAAH